MRAQSRPLTRAGFYALLPDADAWLAVVRRLRPAQAWDEVTAAVNAALAPGSCARGWEAALLERAPRRTLGGATAFRRQCSQY